MIAAIGYFRRPKDAAILPRPKTQRDYNPPSWTSGVMTRRPGDRGPRPTPGASDRPGSPAIGESNNAILYLPPVGRQPLVEFVRHPALLLVRSSERAATSTA